MAKKAATPQRSAARGKGKSKGKGAPAGTSLPAGWKELFCTIADAEDAIFQDGAPDIILLDIGLPDSQGFSGLRKLLEAAPEASIGMISADSTAQTVRGAFAEGARAYIPKSLAPQEFEAGMAKFLTVGFFVPADSLASSP